MKRCTLCINAWNSNKAPTSTFPLQHGFANRTLFSYPRRSAVDINCQVCGGGRKIKRAQLSARHPTAAMSLKRMLCSAVLLHYQQTDNLFDSASRERAQRCAAHAAPPCQPRPPLPISINGFLLVIAACARLLFFPPVANQGQAERTRHSDSFCQGGQKKKKK